LLIFIDNNHRYSLVDMVKDFKTSGYFSGSILFFGFLLIPIAITVGAKSIVGAVLIFLLIIVILTTHYRFRIDTEKKVFHDYLWILGMKHGEKGQFDHIDYLFLKASRVSQSMALKAANSTIRKDVIDAYIRLSPENKIHLFTKDSKHDVIVRLKELGSVLGVKVIDYTEEEPVEL
jgi:hypothetical protein